MRIETVIVFLPILIAEALLLSGCSRRDYRLRADEQSYDIIAEKTCDPRWKLPGFDLRPDPRSRFHDPHDPDHPPLPPDDPAAGRSLDAGEWDRLPRVPRVENPAWPVAFGGAPIESDDSPLPTIESLSLANAVDIGLIHSRDYRAQLEEVYLSALSLTLERYRFDIRTSGFMGEPGSEIAVEQQGKETTTLALGPTHVGARKLLPGGTQLVAELANNTLRLLSGSSGTQLRAFHGEVETGVGEVAAEFRRLEEILPQRRAGFDSADSRELFEREIAADRGAFAALRKRVAAAGDRIDARIAETAALLANIARKLTGFNSVIRVELITLTPVDLTPAAAVSLAMKNRLDLMNRRAFVMDARRRIEVAADRLEAGLDIVAEGAISTPPLAGNNRPFDFRAARGAYRLGLVLTTPLDRRRQRNDFRAAQIAYQRARRNFIAAEDQVKLDVRYNLRRLTMERKFFEISRRALRVAVKELEQAIEQGERINGARGGGNGNGNGQQGLNIPRALDNLLDARDELIETWVDYETARLKLARDTGMMQVDTDGVWPAAAQRTWTGGTPAE